MKRKPKKNVVISPHAITRALLKLALVGTERQRSEIRSFLGYNGSLQELESWFDRFAFAHKGGAAEGKPSLFRYEEFLSAAGLATSASDSENVGEPSRWAVLRAGSDSISTWLRRESAGQLSLSEGQRPRDATLLAALHAKVAWCGSAGTPMSFDSPMYGNTEVETLEASFMTKLCYEDYLSVNTRNVRLPVQVELILPRDTDAEYGTGVAPASICTTPVAASTFVREGARDMSMRNARIPAFRAATQLDLVTLKDELGLPSLSQTVASVLHVATLSADAWGLNTLPHDCPLPASVEEVQPEPLVRESSPYDLPEFDRPFGVIVYVPRRGGPIVLYAAWITSPRRLKR